jgi:hypothetical protein
MFSSKPSPFKSSTTCNETDTHAWCNKRGYGYTVFEHSQNDTATTQASHRLEALQNQNDSSKCMYLNANALVQKPSPERSTMLKSSCKNNGAVPKWCVPASTNLKQQEDMFRNVKYDA